MDGFFSLPPTPADSRVRHTCASCGLYRTALSPRMEPYGNFRKGIMNLGEAPGETEDRRGQQWQGKMGQVLQAAYGQLGVDLFEDCVNFNSINCRPTDDKGNNRPPTDQEIAACRHRVLETIKSYHPKVIVLLGGSALTSVLSTRWLRDLGTISRWRGWTIPDREFGAWICPTYHPSFVERGQQEIETIWMGDLRRALAKADEPLPSFEDETKKVEIVTDLSFLLELKGPVAFDYETTGLKPHDTAKQRIVCMSVCNSENKAYAFLDPGSKERRRQVRAFLRSDIPKIAQNMKFEHTWSYNLLNCEVNNWVWDTMLATHVLDNRPDITGLKFQVYAQFGVADYSSEVAPYLKSKEARNGNAVNQIDRLIASEEGRRKLLIYCGLDALFEYRLAMRQMEELRCL